MALTPEEALARALEDIDRDPLAQDPEEVSRHLNMIRGMASSLDQTHTAKLNELSRRTTVPLQTLMALPADKIQALEAPSLMVGSQDSQTRRYYSNPVNAAISRGDEKKLSAGEETWRRFIRQRDQDQGMAGDILHAIKGQSRLADIQEELGLLVYDKIVVGSAVDDARVKDLNDEMIALSLEEQEYDKTEYVAGAISNLTTQGLNALPAVVGGGLVVGLAGAGLALGGIAIGGVLGTASALTLAGGFLAGAGVGAGVSAAERSFKLEAGLAALGMSDIRDDTRTEEFPNGRPIDPEIVRLAAQAVGAVNAGLEVGGLAIIGRAFLKSPVGKRFGREAVTDAAKEALQDPVVRSRLAEWAIGAGTAGAGVLGEASTEAVQEVVEIVFAGAARRQSEATEGTVFQDRSIIQPGDLSQVTEVFKKTVAGLGVPTAAVSGMHLGFEVHRDRRARAHLTALQEFSGIINGTTTKNLSPAKVVEYMQTIGISGEVGLDSGGAVTLAQTRPDILDKLGITKGDVEGAARNGQDIPTDLKTVVANLAEEDQAEVFKFLRGSLNGKTPEDIRNATLASMVSEALSVGAANKQSEVDFQAELTRARKDLRDSGLTKEVAAEQVKTWEFFSRRMAVEKGLELTSTVSKIRVVSSVPREDQKDKRAQVTFLKAGDDLIDQRTGKPIIIKETGEVAKGTRDEILVQVFQGAGDFSSLPHETGHIFLQEMSDWVKTGNASDAFLADWKAIEKWLGADLSKGLTVDQHEAFADTWVAYMLEGKAPTVELQGTFDRFRHWLSQIYRSVIGQALPLTDDIRQSFDRILATEQQIEEVAVFHGLTEMTADVVAGLDLSGAEARELDSPVQRFKAAALSAIQRVSNKDRRAKEEVVRSEVADQVEALLINKLRNDLAGTPQRHAKGATQAKKDFEDGKGPKTRLELADDLLGDVIKDIEAQYNRSASPLIRGAALNKAQRTRGYVKYRAALKKFLRDKFGKTVTVYTAMSPQLLDLASRGSTRGPVTFTLNPNVAREWGIRGSSGGNQNAVILAAEMPTNQVALRGNVANQELVFDSESTQGRLEIVSKPTAFPTPEGVRESPGAKRQGVLPPAPTERSNAGRRLDLEEIKSEFGPEAAKELQRRKLAAKTGKRRLTKTSREYGFDSTFEMVEALLTVPTKTEQIRQGVAQRMAEIDAQTSTQQTALVTDQVEEILNARHQALASKVGRSRKLLVRAAFKRQAEIQFSKLAVSYAMNPVRFSAVLKRSMEKFNKLAKGKDFLGAFEALNTARLNFEMHKLSVKQRDAVGRNKARIGKAAAADPKSMDEVYLQHLKKTVARFGLVPATEKNKPNLELELEHSLKDLVRGDASGVSVDSGPQFPPWLTKEPPVSVTPEGTLGIPVSTKFQDLTVEEYTAAVDLVDHLAHEGRSRVREANVLSKEKLSDLVATLVATIGSRTTPIFSAEEGSIFRGTSESVRTYLVENDMPAFLFRKLDAGEFRGPHQTAILDKWFQADSAKLSDQFRLLKEMQPHLDQLQKTLAAAPKKLLETGVPIPESMKLDRRSWKMLDVIGIAFNMGNHHNRKAIMDGYGLSEGDLQALLAPLSKADWDAIAGIAKTVESLWGEQVKVHKSMRGFTPQEVKGDPFSSTTSEGVEFTSDGWYWHIAFDPGLDPDSGHGDVELGMLNSTAGMFFLNSAPSGHMKGRQKSTGGRPILLDPFAVMGRSLEHSLTYIHFSEIFRDTLKVMNHTDFRNAVAGAFGGTEIVDMLKNGVTNAVHKERQILTSLGSAYSFWSSRVGSQMLAGSLSVGVKQPFSVGLYWRHDDGGLGAWLDGGKRVISGGSQSMEAMYELSPYMRDRRTGIEQEQREAVARAKRGKGGVFATVSPEQAGGLSRARQVAVSIALEFGYITFFDMVAAAPAWWGTYNKVLADTGDISQAVLRADTAVRNTQPSGRPIDQSFVQAQRNGIQSLFGFFGGFRLKFGAIQRQDIDLWRNGKITDTQFATNVMVNWIMTPVIMQTFMHTIFYWRDAEELDPEKLAADVFLYNLIGFPGITESAGFLAHLAGLRDFPREAFDSPPLALAERTLKQLYSLGEFTVGLQDEDEKASEKATENVVDLLSLGTGRAFHRVYDATSEGLRQVQEEGKPPWVMLSPDPERRER